MAKRKSMYPPLDLCETQVFGEEVGKADALKRLGFYLKLVEDCMERVHKMPSQKFNNEQCAYLTNKFKIVVESAYLFLEISRAEGYGPYSSVDIAKWVEIFKLLLALAKQIESFVQGCCKDAWIQAAMTLTNVSEYVSLLGFNMELCRVAFCKEYPATESLTLLEVDDINKAEVEMVNEKAIADMGSLLKKVTLELNSLSTESRDLASYLLQKPNF